MERYIIRDIETKKILIRNGKKITFKSYVPAVEYINSMAFNLGYYYEVFDDKEQEVFYQIDPKRYIGRRDKS